MTPGARAGSTALERRTRPDGAEVLRNVEALGPYPERMTDRLEHWAEACGERVFLAERSGEGWRTISYAETLGAVRAIGQALVERGLGPERGVAVLSENGIDHALVGLAAQYVGAPYAPISASYSLVSSDFAKLRGVLDGFGPGLVFADDGARYARAIAATVPRDVEVVTLRGDAGHPVETAFAEVARSRPDSSLDAAHARVDGDTIAKVLFTSGTTGQPKGVTCAQRMICSNTQMFGQMFPFVRARPPVLLDWLPWNHTFGGNSNFGVVLYYGGTLFVNDGKPTPALAERTRRNLRDVAPTIYFDVPKGFELLVEFLRDDAALRARFFGELDLMMYAGAGMSRPVWDALRDLARETTGRDPLITTSLGSTETGPMALTLPVLAPGPGYVGVPVPGIEMKLVPNGDKAELRLRGPSMTAGYWRAPALTNAAFDDEGFYMIGDAVRYVDRDHPSKGFLFDGRISEDFKLDTGTWVSVGPLRLRALAHFAPLLADAVVSGENRRELALLAFPDRTRVRELATGVAADAAFGEVLASAEVREAFREALARFAATSTGSATRIARLVLLDEAPSVEAGEITDKGSLNVRAIVTRRASSVESAHAPSPPAHVIALE